MVISRSVSRFLRGMDPLRKACLRLSWNWTLLLTLRAQEEGLTSSDTSWTVASCSLEGTRLLVLVDCSRSQLPRIHEGSFTLSDDWKGFEFAPSTCERCSVCLEGGLTSSCSTLPSAKLQLAESLKGGGCGYCLGGVAASSAQPSESQLPVAFKIEENVPAVATSSTQPEVSKAGSCWRQVVSES